MKDVQISEFAAIVNPQLSSGGARPWGSDALSSELTKGSGWITSSSCFQWASIPSEQARCRYSSWRARATMRRTWFSKFACSTAVRESRLLAAWGSMRSFVLPHAASSTGSAAVTESSLTYQPLGARRAIILANRPRSWWSGLRWMHIEVTDRVECVTTRAGRARRRRGERTCPRILRTRGEAVSRRQCIPGSFSVDRASVHMATMFGGRQSKDPGNADERCRGRECGVRHPFENDIRRVEPQGALRPGPGEATVNP